MVAIGNALEFYAPDFDVKLLDKNEKLPKDNISSLEIDEDLENPGMFAISMKQILGINTQEFDWLDDENMAPGKKTLVAFGYASSPKGHSLMRGRVKALSPSFLSTGGQTLRVEGYDLSHDLQKTRGKPGYNKKTYSQVVEEIARENGLDTAGIDSTIINHEKIERSRNEKDYAFIKRLATNIGFEFFVRDNALYFRKPRDDKQGEITFEFRKDIINFNPRMSSANLVNEVKVTAWNEKNKERIEETARITDIQSSVGIPGFDNIVKESQGSKVEVNVEDRVVRYREEAKELALAELRRKNNGFIQGSLDCIGNPQLRPGMTINIEKIGNRFSGVYYITKGKHTIDNSGYKTSLDVRRSVF